MTLALVKAFEPVRSTAKFIGDTYDKTGFLALRVMMDNSFLDINPERFKSPGLQKAAHIYNSTTDLAQKKVSDSVMQTMAAVDVGPKPDFKKPILNLGTAVLKNLGPMHVTTAAVMTLSLGVIFVAAHIATQGNLMNVIPDAAATYLGLKPTSSAPEPKPESP